MAKCIKILSTEQIIRVPDETARRLVGEDRAEYIDKESWKEGGRVQFGKGGPING